MPGAVLPMRSASSDAGGFVSSPPSHVLRAQQNQSKRNPHRFPMNSPRAPQVNGFTVWLTTHVQRGTHRTRCSVVPVIRAISNRYEDMTMSQIQHSNNYAELVRGGMGQPNHGRCLGQVVQRAGDSLPTVDRHPGQTRSACARSCRSGPRLRSRATVIFHRGRSRSGGLGPGHRFVRGHVGGRSQERGQGQHHQR